MSRYLRAFVILSLTVGLMAFFLRNAELDRVWAEMSTSRLDLLVWSLLAMALSYLVRVERWRRLLQPVGPASLASAGRATVIGFAANALLPGRVGEVLRPYVLARRERLSGSAAFATIVLERLLDLLAIVLMVAVFMVLDDPPTTAPQLLGALRVGALVAGIFAIASLALVVLLVRSPGRADRVARWCAYVAPSGVVRAITRVAQRFLQGLSVVRRPGPLVIAMLLSFVLWVSVSVSMWMTSLAFGIDLSFGGSVILMGMVAIGVSVPTPAGVGGYHAAYQLGATALYGAGVDAAVGAALVMHAISFGPVTLLGLVFMAQEGLRLGSLAGLGSAEAGRSAETETHVSGSTVDPVPVVSVAPAEDDGGVG
jgi:hypothetical protein